MGCYNILYLEVVNKRNPKYANINSSINKQNL